MTERPAPTLDRVLYPLSRFADNSVLWMGVAALLAARGGRANRRAALRGLVSVGITSALTNGVLKPLTSRSRPVSVPSTWLTKVARVPKSSSFPSGHSASAAAFATGAALEAPYLGVPLGLVGTAVGWSRVRTRVHYPIDVVAGFAVGAALAYSTTRWWPRTRRAPAAVPAVRARVHPGDADGAGLSVVVNPAAGSASSDELDALQRELPAANFMLVGDDEDLGDLLSVIADSEAMGVVGGDGSINAAVGVALANDKPLAVFPGGTLNHFARDLGLTSVDMTVDAVRRGCLGAVDVGLIDGQPFVNTASFGSYAALVDVRERFEHRLGKWPAMALALFVVLAREKPVEVTINGTRRCIWLIFIGNCEYGPPGLAPISRKRLDDGLLDVRWVEDVGAMSRVRVAFASLTGKLAKSRSYHRELVETLSIESLDGPMRIARDGETVTGSRSFTVEKSRKKLAVFVEGATESPR